jgi:predicted metal-dependent hydrolase
MLSIKSDGDTVSVRMHRIFLSAENDVLKEITDFIKNSNKKTPLIRNFINQNTYRLEDKPPKKVSVRTLGKHYNLLDIYNAINKEYFEEKISATITWGTKGPRRAAARRTLGSYSFHNVLIRINPILDTKSVPRYFLEFVVYHEMLHADMDNKNKPGRRLLHSKEFKKREKQFKHYDRALAWERKRWD